GHLGVGHPGADVHAADPQALAPRLVEDLVAGGDDEVDVDVLRARGMPEQPRQRVHAGRPCAHLLVGEPAEDPLPHRGGIGDAGSVEAAVVDQEEVGGVHTLVTIEGGASPSARSSAAASAASCSCVVEKMRHWATLPGRYFKISVSGSSETFWLAAS